MSYQQKQNLIALITTIFVSIPYLVAIFLQYQTSKPSSLEELSFWVTAIFLMIPLRIAASIIITIIFSIVNSIATGEKKENMTVDERDKQINLKSIRNSYYTFVVGFFLALILANYNQSISTMFAVIIIAGTIAEIVSIISKLFITKKVFKNAKEDN